MSLDTSIGTATADSFVTVEYCDNYHAGFGNELWTGEPAAKEAVIKRATAYVSASYNYVGSRTNGRNQSLSWPRTGVNDKEGFAIGSDEIPREIMDATCEAALFELTNPNGLNPTVVMTDRVKVDRVGDVSTEYFDTALDAETVRPILSKLDALLCAVLTGQKGADATRYLDRV